MSCWSMRNRHSLVSVVGQSNFLLVGLLFLFVYMIICRWLMTHPTAWNTKANFKVVRLAAATSEIGENVSPAG